MSVLSRRGPRRPAPPSVRLHDPVPWVDPSELSLPLWRRLVSAGALVVLLVVLGVLLTVAIGAALLGAFFLLELIVG